MLKRFFNPICVIIAMTFIAVSMANAQVFNDGDIVHLKDANGTPTDANLVDIENTSSLATLDLFFRVSIDANVAAGTQINVTPLVPTNQTAPTPTFEYKNGNQWAALQTATNGATVSIAYTVLEDIATDLSVTSVEVRVSFTTVPTYRFQVELDTTSLDRVYFDCYPGGTTHSVYDVTEDGNIDSDDITAVSTAMENSSLTGDVSEDGRINYVDFDLVTFAVGLGFSAPVTNSAPTAVGTIPDQTVNVGGDSLTVDVSSYFSDSDGDTLTYTVSSSDTTKVSVSVSSSTVTITGVAVGTATITVTATDPGGLTGTQTFSVTAVQPNRAPVGEGTIPDQTVGATAVTVDVSSYFSDPDGDTLTYTAASSDTAKATVSVSSSTVSITRVAVGTATITVTATDPGGLAGTQTFTATVTNQAPTVSTIPDQIVAASGGTRTLDLDTYFTDPDGQTLTYTAASDTAIATVSVSGSTLTITGKDIGTATVTVTGTDPLSLNVSQTIAVSVKNPPTAVGTIPDTGGAVGWGTITVDVSSYFSDPNGQTLSYSASSSDTQLATVSVSSSDVKIQPISAGTVTVTVTATNTDGLSATQSFSVTLYPKYADAIPGLSSEERLLLGALLSYDTVIFNELYNSADDATDWLELRNVSGADLALEDWELTIRTGGGDAVIEFPTGTVIPVGSVLLLVNTEPSTADAALSSIVSEAFALPQTDFALILRSPTAFGDIAGNYFDGERPETAAPLTVDTVWYRSMPIVSGYRAEAWAESIYQEGTGTPGYRHPDSAADLNNDGVINILDLVLVASQFGMNDTPAADLNNDGTVNIQDLVVVANAFGDIAGAPGAQQSTASVVNQWLQLARENAAGFVETSLLEGFSYERGIFTLEQLARAFVPETTALLANYPNPFNPETWIPYQLSKAVEVAVTIYAADGSVVRTLALGHRDAGMYHNRSQAVYWNGRNELGETVSSGVYFYTLTAGDFAATRKMLILK